MVEAVFFASQGNSPRQQNAGKKPVVFMWQDPTMQTKKQTI